MRLGLLRPGERAPKIGFRLVQELAADGFHVAVACRVLKVSRSGYYEWRHRPPSARVTSRTRASRHRPQLPRHVTLLLRRPAGARGATARDGGPGRPQTRRQAATHLRAAWDQPPTQAPAPAGSGCQSGPGAAQVRRRWAGPVVVNRTHRTHHRGGKVYCAAVLDVFTREVVGRAIADHMRTEVVVVALQMTIWRRRPPSPGPWSTRTGAANTDPGSSGTSSAMPACLDPWAGSPHRWTTPRSSRSRRPCNANTRSWETPEELGAAIFECIEAWYNPRRRHTSACSAAWTTSTIGSNNRPRLPFTPPSTERHDHHTTRVRRPGQAPTRYISGVERV